MDTINISADTRKLQICADKDLSYNLSGVFFQKGYAFATNGHFLAIRRTSLTEPQDAVLSLPKPKGKKVLDLELRDIDGRLISLAEGEAIRLDFIAPDVGCVLRDHAGSSRNKIQITINARYLMDIAKALGADKSKDCPVTLELDPEAPTKGILVATTDSSTLGILMPLKAPKTGGVYPSGLLSPILALLK